KKELTDLRHEIEPNPHSAFSIVLVRLGVAKIDKESVAHETGDMPAHPSNYRGATTLECADHVAQVLRIELGRQSRRADEIAKKDGQLASLCLGLRQGKGRGRRAGGGFRARPRSDRSEGPFSMAERNAQSLEIGLGHIGQDIEIAGNLGKDGR